jgi:hypothetical protein
MSNVWFDTANIPPPGKALPLGFQHRSLKVLWVRRQGERNQLASRNGKQEEPACQKVCYRKRKTISADGCAVCVQLSVFKALSPKSGFLYTKPLYSARNEKCRVRT